MALVIGIALAIDALQLPLNVAFFASIFAIPAEVADIVFDLLVAGTLSYFLGFRWLFVPSLLLEAVPLIDALPTWTACVAFILWRQRRAAMPLVSVSERPNIPTIIDVTPTVEPTPPVVVSTVAEPASDLPPELQALIERRKQRSRQPVQVEYPVQAAPPLLSREYDVDIPVTEAPPTADIPANRRSWMPKPQLPKESLVITLLVIPSSKLTVKAQAPPNASASRKSSSICSGCIGFESLGHHISSSNFARFKLATDIWVSPQTVVHHCSTGRQYSLGMRHQALKFDPDYVDARRNKTSSTSQ